MELSLSVPFILLKRLTNLTAKAREFNEVNLQAVMASPYVTMPELCSL